MYDVLVAFGVYSTYAAIDYIKAESEKITRLPGTEYNPKFIKDQFKADIKYTSRMNIGRKCRERGPKLR